MPDLDWNSIVGTRATMLHTRKRDGSWVSTPVSAVASGSVAYVLTNAATGKVKWLHNFSDVQVASCTFRGEIDGPLYSATARRLEGAEFAAGLRVIRAKHPVMFGVVIRLRYWVRRTEPAVYELSTLRPRP